MLNVTAQRSSEAAKSYFAQSDYYSEGQELVGNWGGKGAILLGLFGEVDCQAFEHLCDNRDWRTAKQLTPLNLGSRRVGYDFTWSAPKSVSVVHALTGDERIVEAFRESIGDTMSEMEEDMATRVRRGGDEKDRTTGNMTWAEFVHLTSRPVDGLPCPQLHSHVFAFNATYDPVESRWKAGQFGRIKGDAYYWQAVQQARFANRLQELGYAVRKTKDAFEISDIPDSVLNQFSLRTMQIEKVAEKLGITDPKTKAKLGATTREAKLPSIPYPELVAKWDSMVTPAERQAVHTAKGAPVVPARDDAAHARYAIEHIFERASVADERRLLTLALRHGCGEVTPEGVRGQVSGVGLLRREETGRMLVTTREVLAEEQRMLDFAVKGKGACRPISASLEHWQEKLNKSQLSDEQRAVVADLLISPDRVMIIRGVAGSGKTRLTREAVELLEEAGRDVVMLAPSAQASRGVLRTEGFENADTLARFLIDEKMQSSAKNGVIWLDESGMVGSRSIGKLFDVAERVNARVVLAGDKRQTAPVERGSALRVLEDVAGLKLSEVTDIRRQSGEYKAAVKLLSEGKADKGLDKLNELGWIKTFPVWNKYEPVAKDYAEKLNASLDREKGVLIVCPTHAEGAKLTEQVRTELKSQGLVGLDDHQFTRLVPTQWTEAQRGDIAEYRGDEIVQFHRNSGAFKAGERVAAPDLLQTPGQLMSSRFTAFRPASIEVATGDLLRIAANGKTKDGKHKLNNGAVYTCEGFTASGDIVLSNGWVMAKDFGTFEHAYVSTTQASQGRTVNHVIVCQSGESAPASSREGFYVAVSRGRYSATIWCDGLRDLREAVTQSNLRMSATEMLQKPKPQLWRRMREHMARMQLAAMIAAKSLVHSITPAREQYDYAR